MLHITHFVLVFSLAVGVAAIGVSAEMYRRYRLDYLRGHLAIVITFNLMIFISMIALYIFNLPGGTLAAGLLRAVEVSYLFIIPLLHLLAAYFFLQIVRGLLGRTITRNIRSVGWAVLGAYTAAQATALAAPIDVGRVPLSLVNRPHGLVPVPGCDLRDPDHTPAPRRKSQGGRKKKWPQNLLASYSRADDRDHRPDYAQWHRPA